MKTFLFSKTHFFGRVSFHVQKLVLDALQEIRIKHRWDALDEETNNRDNAKWDNKIYTPFRFDYTKVAHWYNKVTDSGFRSFNSISATIHTHYKEILNFFENRSTNASAESFNAKLKAFRAALRGVSDIKYFLYRVAKIYA